MGIREYLFGKNPAPVAETLQTSGLNVNVVTEGRVVGVPQPSGELPVLVNFLTDVLRPEEIRSVVLEYLSHRPDAPAHSLSAETAQAVEQVIRTRIRQRQIMQNIPRREPTKLGEALGWFGKGREDSERIYLIKQNITSG